MDHVFEKDAVHAIATEVLARAEKMPENAAAVIALSGDLGAGKTTLSQEIGRTLGVAEQMVSPTFVILKRYGTTHTRWHTLIHIDAYRLEQDRELYTLGWEDILRDPHTLVLIEWPEKVPGCIPEQALSVHLSHEGESTRRVVIR
jgi:tRNA threonylcarbamoyladenosine biosynthesis protein TsaE